MTGCCEWGPPGQVCGAEAEFVVYASPLYPHDSYSCRAHLVAMNNHARPPSAWTIGGITARAKAAVAKWRAHEAERTAEG